MLEGLSIAAVRKRWRYLAAGLWAQAEVRLLAGEALSPSEAFLGFDGRAHRAAVAQEVNPSRLDRVASGSSWLQLRVLTDRILLPNMRERGLQFPAASGSEF